MEIRNKSTDQWQQKLSLLHLIIAFYPYQHFFADFIQLLLNLFLVFHSQRGLPVAIRLVFQAGHHPPGRPPGTNHILVGNWQQVAFIVLEFGLALCDGLHACSHVIVALGLLGQFGFLYQVFAVCHDSCVSWERRQGVRKGRTTGRGDGLGRQWKCGLEAVTRERKKKDHTEPDIQKKMYFLYNLKISRSEREPQNPFASGPKSILLQVGCCHALYMCSTSLQTLQQTYDSRTEIKLEFGTWLVWKCARWNQGWVQTNIFLWEGQSSY